jgi:hypothetical protein
MKNIKQFESYSDSEYDDDFVRKGFRHYEEQWREKISPGIKKAVNEMLEGAKKKSGGEPTFEDMLNILAAVELLSKQDAVEMAGVYSYLQALNPDFKFGALDLSDRERENHPTFKALYLMKPYIQELNQKYPDRKSLAFDFFPQKKMF